MHVATEDVSTSISMEMGFSVEKGKCIYVAYPHSLKRHKNGICFSRKNNECCEICEANKIRDKGNL